MVKTLKIIGNLVVLAWFWGGSWASAVEVPGLYEASVEVRDRSATQRRQAQQEAFATVLVKVSGDSSIITQSHIQQSLSNADRYMEQFGFQTRDLPSTSPDEAPAKAIFLDVKFDRAAVNQLLRENGHPIWASNRPRIVLWLAYDNGFGREIMGGDNLSQLQQRVMNKAQQRGIALTIPRLNARDKGSVHAGDIWGMFMAPLAEGSKAYAGDVVVAAKVQQVGERANLWATLRIGSEDQSIKISGKGLEATLEELVETLADRVGSAYAVVISAQSTGNLLLRVENIESLSEYAGLMQYLRKVIAVKAVHTQLVQSTNVELLVELEGKESDFMQSLKLDKALTLVEEEASTFEPPMPLEPGDPTQQTVREPERIRLLWSNTR